MAGEESPGTFKSNKPYSRIEQKYVDASGGTQSVVIADKKNAMLYGGINLALKESDPDYVALDMANEMLGGGEFLSRREFRPVCGKTRG